MEYLKCTGSEGTCRRSLMYLSLCANVYYIYFSSQQLQISWVAIILDTKTIEILKKGNLDFIVHEKTFSRR